MGDIISEFSNAFGDALSGVVIGIAIGMIVSVGYNIALQSTMPVTIIIAVSAMIDIVGIFSLAQESLGVPLLYLAARVLGYLFAISILQSSGLPVTPALVNLAILIVALMIRVYVIIQEWSTP